jgi:hypothetical protein
MNFARDSLKKANECGDQAINRSDFKLKSDPVEHSQCNQWESLGDHLGSRLWGQLSISLRSIRMDFGFRERRTN